MYTVYKQCLTASWLRLATEMLIYAEALSHVRWLLSWRALFRMAVTGSPTVLHLLVVGFHHSKGSVIEYAYPEFRSGESGNPIEVPKEWNDLVHLCIPDGAHNSDQDTVYFTIPNREHGDTSRKILYGVACYRQAATDSLNYTPDEVTRSTMLKSVCVICTLPLFGTIEARLNAATHAYFSEGDFRKVTILEELYSNLCTTIMPAPVTDLAQFGVSPRLIVEKFGRATLQLFKALLLHARVLLVGSCARVTCGQVLSLFSLLPNSLETLMNPQQASNSNEVHFSCFSNPQYLKPFVCLSQSKALRSKDSKWLIAGAINPLFGLQQKSYCEVFGGSSNGVVEVNTEELGLALQLSAADLRFTDKINKAIHEGIDDTLLNQPSPVHWYGSDDWIRVQFKEYVNSLVVTSIRGDPAAQEDFNPHFIKLWLKSECFMDCANKHIPGGHGALLEEMPPRHICAGKYTWSDVRTKVMLNTSEFRMVASGLAGRVRSSNVGAAMGKMLNNATTSVWSWWNQNPEEQSSTDSSV